MKRIDLLEIIENGGATLDGNGAAVTFARGYQVSKKDCYILTIGETGKILRAVNKILNGLQRGEYCGIWVDGGRVYIDVSERIKNRRAALRIGKARKQISVYDWRAGACVYC